MRKFMKGCAVTALIFILLGLILGVSGSLGNGSTHVSPGEILSAVTLGRISGEEVDDWSNGVTEQIREIWAMCTMIWRTMWIMTQIMKLGRER